MEAFVITATLFGSFATAFFIQRAALEGLFRMMDPNRRERPVIPARRRIRALFARAAARVLQLGLTNFYLLPLGLADHESAASQVFRFKQLIFGQKSSPLTRLD